VEVCLTSAKPGKPPFEAEEVLAPVEAALHFAGRKIRGYKVPVEEKRAG